MKLHQMRAFEALVRLGTVTRAAAELGVSQPAISRTISQLEDEVSLSLFETVNGRLVPTPHANALMPGIKRILSQMADLDRHAADLRDGKRGILRIAVAPSSVLAVVQSGFTAFHDASPDALLDIVTARTRSVIGLVASGQVDMGFCQLNGMENNVVSHLSVKGAVVCVLPQHHELARRSELSLGDLASERIITFSDDELTGRRIGSAFARAGIHLNHAMTIGQTLPAINLVGAGYGIGLVDSFFVTDFEQAQSARLPANYQGLRVLQIVPTIGIDMHLLTSTSRPLSYLAEIFIDAVMDRFGRRD